MNSFVESPILFETENAADVAVQLADITNNELSTEELSKVVTVVTRLVNVARINFTLASAVVTIISNMISAESVQPTASEMYVCFSDS